MLPNHEEKLSTIKTLLLEFSNTLNDSLKTCYDGFKNSDMSYFIKAKDSLKNSSKLANKIDNEILTTLALFGAEAGDLRELVAYLKTTNELARIMDNINSFCKKIILSENYNKELIKSDQEPSYLCLSALKATQYIAQAIDSKDNDELKNIYTKVEIEESKTDDFYSVLQKNILSDLYAKHELTAEALHFLSAMRKFEKIADRSASIVKLMLFAKFGGKMDIY
ncbi:phosphate transport system regulatory protein [Campylobacter blaseri]|uniref:PhoU family transcriptional regulator n=1 Tax=Campylobacter blaseri TaxID=2042961 RepID=A0A2P8R3P9_9BACT|nr:PhoU domain-containing protein [Campylobacter blaseri]PSM53126.1 PhoU family transcriptional regulator [Campylobacter blaseri]PSM54592.1 PhoU family transcriptional regulator [Campylobacter blaseri]QKF86935.1 phosphate transport system regulatory protein [Campylobacter blaseri]